MIFRYLTRFFLFLVFVMAFTRVANAWNIHTFQKISGGKGDDEACTVLELKDKGFLVAGITTSYGSGGNDVLVVRMDSLGNITWSQTYGSTSDEGTVAFSISWNVDMIQSPDNNFVICTNASGFGAGGRDVFFFKIDINGNILWERTFGGSDEDMGVGICNSPGGGFVITGETASFGSGNGDVLLLKTDNDGNFVWAKAYGGSSQEEAGYKVRPSADGGYLICGISLNVPNTYDELIMKVDGTGKLVWSGVYGHDNYDLSSDIIELPDKSIYVAGQSWINWPEGVKHLLKFDKNGKLLWSKSLGSHALKNIIYDKGHNVFNTDGFVRLSGVQYLDFLRIDTSGKPVMMKTFGPAVSSGGYSTGHGSGLIPVSTGGFMEVGTEANFGFGGHDFYFLKLDPDANTNTCWGTNQSPSVINWVIGNHSYNFSSVNINAQTKPYAWSGKKLSIMDSFLCIRFWSNYYFSTDCSGNTVNFSDVSFQKPTQWKWDFGEPGSPGNTSFSQNPLHLYQKKGIYTVKLVSGNGVLKDSITKTVTVKGPLKSQGIKDTIICPGDRIQLIVSNTGNYYKWFPDLSNGDSTKNAVWVSPVKNQTVIAQVFNNIYCYVYDTFNIKVDSGININLGPERYICPGSFALIKSNLNDTGLKYTWQDSSHFSYFTALKPGKYWVLVTRGTCARTDTVLVTALNKPVAFIGHDTTICRADTFIIDLKNLPPQTTVQWQDRSSATNYAISNPGHYSVTLSNACGVSSAPIEVTQSECECDFFVPNAFTPNRDTVNDIFIPMGCDAKLRVYDLKIYNRWGELIFETRDRNKGWDGKFHGQTVIEGVYIYILDYKTKNAVERKISGTITVLK